MNPDTIRKLHIMVEFIRQFQKDNLGASPSMQEIAAHLKCAVTYVSRLMVAAVKRGMVRRKYGAIREIEVLQ